MRKKKVTGPKMRYDICYWSAAMFLRKF